MKPYIKSDFVGGHGELGTAAKVPPAGSGADVTAAAVAAAIGDMNRTQTAQALEDLGGEKKLLAVTVTGSGGNYSADKTYTEITTAYAAGNKLRFAIERSYGTIVTDDVLIVNETLVLAFATIAQSITSNPEMIIVSINPHNQVGVVSNPLTIKPTTVTVSGTTPTITPADNHIYNCGTLDSLTISNPTETGAYSIVFTSGATPTQTTIPATILGLEDFAAEANTLYEINVLDNRAVVGSWAVSV